MNKDNLNSFYISIRESISKIGSYSDYLNRGIFQDSTFNYLHAIRCVKKDLEKIFEEEYLERNFLVGIIITNESIQSYKSINDLSNDANQYAKRNIFPLVVSKDNSLLLPKGIIAYNPELQQKRINTNYSLGDLKAELTKRSKPLVRGVKEKSKILYIGPGPSINKDTFIGPGNDGKYS